MNPAEPRPVVSRKRPRKAISAVRLEISPIELWAIRASAGAIMAVLAWIGIQVHTGLIHIAELRTELAITKPADVLEAVRQMERDALDAEDVEAIVKRTAPWSLQEPVWRQWRSEIDQRLRALEFPRKEPR